jgi:hypothetical protein
MASAFLGLICHGLLANLHFVSRFIVGFWYAKITKEARQAAGK